MTVTISFPTLINSTKKLTMSTSNECPVKKEIGLSVSTSPTATTLTATSTSSSNTSVSSSYSLSLPEKSSVKPQPPEIPALSSISTALNVAAPVKLLKPSAPNSSSNVPSFFIKDILSGSPNPPHHSIDQHHYHFNQNQYKLKSEENQFSDNDENEPKVGMQVKTKQRAARTAFTDHQLQTLEMNFEQCKYPSVTERKELAVELKLSNRLVKTWYQNRRTKWRKQQAVGIELLADESNYNAIKEMIEANPNWINQMTNIMPKQITPYDMYYRQASLIPQSIYPNFFSPSVPSSYQAQPFIPSPSPSSSSSSTIPMPHETTDKSE